MFRNSLKRLNPFQKKSPTPSGDRMQTEIERIKEDADVTLTGLEETTRICVNSISQRRVVKV